MLCLNFLSSIFSKPLFLRKTYSGITNIFIYFLFIYFFNHTSLRIPPRGYILKMSKFTALGMTQTIQIFASGLQFGLRGWEDYSHLSLTQVLCILGVTVTLKKIIFFFFFLRVAKLDWDIEHLEMLHWCIS